MAVSRKRRSVRSKSRLGCLIEPLEVRRLLSTASGAFRFGNAGNELITGMTAGTVGNSGRITFVTGTFTGALQLSTGTNGVTLTSAGGTDIFVIAYTATNTILWAKSFGGTGDEIGGDVAIAGNNLVVTGSFALTMDVDPGTATTNLTSRGGTDAFIARLSTAAGAFVSGRSWGGTGNDTAGNLTTDGSSNAYILGTFSATADLDPGAGTTTLTAFQVSDPYLLKVNTTNNLVWVNHYTTDDLLTLSNVAVTAAGLPILAGTFRGDANLSGSGTSPATFNAVRTQGFVTIMTATGGTQITRQFGEQGTPTANEPFFVTSLAIDASSNIFVGGRFTGTVNVDPGVAHTLTAPAGVTAATGADAYAGFVMKLDSIGQYVWANSYNGTGASEVLDLATDPDGNVYAAGDFVKSIDVDFSTATVNITNAAPVRAAFLASYDTTGAFTSENHATAATGASLGEFVSVTSDKVPTLGGVFGATVTFPTTGTGSTLTSTVLTSAGGTDGFLLQFATTTTGKTVPNVTLALDQVGALPAQAVIVTVAVAGTPTMKTTNGTVTTTAATLATGQVKISDLFNGKTTTLATVTLDATGTGHYVYFVTGGGPHVISATYEGDVTYSLLASNTSTVTVVIPTQPLGGVDKTTGGVLTGWAAIVNSTAQLVVNVLIDGQVRGAFVAKAARADILALVGSAGHGFAWQLPPLEAGGHTIGVVAYDPVTGAGTVLQTFTYVSNDIFFDEAYYLAHNPDVKAALASGAITSPYLHFVFFGSHEGRSPSATFDEMWYRAANPDVAAAIAAGTIPSGFYQYEHSGERQGRDPSAFFNEAFYRAANPDVAAAIAAGAVASGYRHFLRSGLTEGRAPVPWFNDAQYRAANPDVAAAIAAGTLRSAYDQFVNSGLAQGRAPSAVYDESFYLAQNPDVAAAVHSHDVASGLVQFVYTGFYEGRLSDPHFDAAYYLSQHPLAGLLVANGTYRSVFQHYLLVGQLEGFAKHA